MVSYSNSEDEIECFKSLHKNQPYFCELIDPIADDPRCFEAHKFCTLFCSNASEQAELFLNASLLEYIIIQKEYFDTVAHLVIQQNSIIGKRGLTYPDRIKKYVLYDLGFDEVDEDWLLMMIPSFLYTIEIFFGKENPELFFMRLYDEL